MVGCEWVCKIMARYAKVLLGVCSCGWVCYDMAGFEKFWLGAQKYFLVLENMA